MKNCCLAVALFCAVNICALGEPRTFDWVRASDESAQLDPADFHAGRVYRSGTDGGNIHVHIDASQPVTIALTPGQSWTDA
jgi:hypothetical protein